MIKLSVIIPCLNAASTLGAQLDALSRQDFGEPFEVIVADNGSTDHSMTIAATYRDRIPNLKILDASSVPGPAHARNAGVEAASGEFLLFCDADDEASPGWVTAMADALRDHDFVAGSLEFEKLNEPWVIGTMSMQSTGLVPSATPPYLPSACGANMGYRRLLANAIGQWDETLQWCEDADFCWRAQIAGFKLHFVPEARIHYRMRRSIEELYRQAIKWGKGSAIAHARYDTRQKRFATLRAILWASRQISSAPVFSPTKRNLAEWLWEFGFRIGNVKGIWQHTQARRQTLNEGAPEAYSLVRSGDT